MLKELWKQGKDVADDEWHAMLEAWQTPLMGAGQMVQYVIYDHPKDKPEHYVIRRWEIHGTHVKECEAFGYKKLEDARSVLPDGVTCLSKMPGDDPSILEVWI